jgi:micrococcal nuclease
MRPIAPLALLAILSAPPSAMAAERVTSDLIKVSGVLSGDTISVAGQRWKLEGIVAPDLFAPRCAAEEAFGMRAKARLGQLIAAGHRRRDLVAEITRPSKDSLGRVEGRLSTGIESVSATLIREGLAHPDGASAPWCADAKIKSN